MVNKDYYIYILYCADDSLYCGFTDNVDRRVHMHQSYRGAKYTRVKKRHPLKLIYSEKFTSKHDALHAEYCFKHQTRQQKENFLMEHGIDLLKERRNLNL
ncbi:GIY-YIG nuclease family protein [Limosilactobacillus sp. STM2_1]|uniref:GIY-YIG nuclease family protein n=1 Tax=Limosilactobacillus rudii TaxID=2759755 RepID=A0A7W3UKG1_9LACO|nr:GIY-YIG nuclease family protein [Limosilactobacillus rudii]MBB1078616.1 GIY-YIG nuclease family protein [Limosilactobacillus rudii]MBB1097256.1 GIY-YIG nuclease family protein [Limosilactobacillus rudii]MCD7133828.1 GIY-YIG nuclease family protein [Limosilactobacillus rudii]